MGKDWPMFRIDSPKPSLLAYFRLSSAPLALIEDFIAASIPKEDSLLSQV